MPCQFERGRICRLPTRVKPEDYRRYAAECLRIAQEFRGQAEAALLLEMAERWRGMAEEAERRGTTRKSKGRADRQQS
jgi:hypothetical protein